MFGMTKNRSSLSKVKKLETEEEERSERFVCDGVLATFLRRNIWIFFSAYYLDGIFFRARSNPHWPPIHFMWFLKM